jgi:hypothetical protein
MCDVLLPPGVNPIVIKYIISYHISYHNHVIYHIVSYHNHSTSYRISYRIIIMSYHISYHNHIIIISYITSYNIVSYNISYHNHVISYHIVSNQIISYKCQPMNSRQCHSLIRVTFLVNIFNAWKLANTRSLSLSLSLWTLYLELRKRVTSRRPALFIIRTTEMAARHPIESPDSQFEGLIIPLQCRAI